MIAFRRPSAALIAAGVLAVSTVASAQPQQPGAGAQQPDVAQLLHLRPDQMGALQALQRANQPTPDEIARLRATSPQALAGLTTPQRLDRLEAVQAARDAIFHRGDDALRAFYNQLSPDQRSTFDRLSAASTAQGRGRPPQ